MVVRSRANYGLEFKIAKKKRKKGATKKKRIRVKQDEKLLVIHPIANVKVNGTERKEQHSSSNNRQ